jgi:hypothetical protein
LGEIEYAHDKDKEKGEHKRKLEQLRTFIPEHEVPNQRGPACDRIP